MVARSQRIWGAWIAGIAATFAYLEYTAYRRGRFLTLSRCLARWLGIEPRTRWGRFGPVTFVLAWAALAVHVARIKADQS